jgi:hypothetical protein
MKAAFVQGGFGARGTFAETLDMLTLLLHGRVREAVERRDDRSAAGTARALELVELAKERAAGNVSPQLVTASLLRDLGDLVR